MAYVYIFLGVGFRTFASLAYTNNINVTEHSIIQDHILIGQIYSLFAIAFIALLQASRISSKKQDRLQSELLISGKKTQGIVEKI